jgi:hypothetical protein
MSHYQIVRWDGILAKNGINKQPIIFIMPDMDFLEFAKNNNYILSVEINGTNTIYDGKTVLGSVNNSCFMPNFSAQTHLYVIVLDCIWNGLPNPDSLGTATFYGLKD